MFGHTTAHSAIPPVPRMLGVVLHMCTKSPPQGHEYTGGASAGRCARTSSIRRAATSSRKALSSALPSVSTEKYDVDVALSTVDPPHADGGAVDAYRLLVCVCERVCGGAPLRLNHDAEVGERVGSRSEGRSDFSEGYSLLLLPRARICASSVSIWSMRSVTVSEGGGGGR